MRTMSLQKQEQDLNQLEEWYKRIARTLGKERRKKVFENEEKN